MIKIKAQELVKKRKGSEVYLKQLSPRRGSINKYRKSLRALLRIAAEVVRDDILVRYETRKPQHLSDADGSWFEAFERLLDGLAKRAAQAAGLDIGAEAEWHREQFMQDARSKLGIDLKAVVLEADVDDYLSAVAERNAALIKGLTDDAVKEVKMIITTAYANGDSVKTVKARLKAKFSKLASRADLIAEDQMNKISSELTEIRQRQIGADGYIWTTSLDERVRHRHAVLHGKFYRWDEETDAEEGLHAGRPIRCRCIPRGVIKW